MQDSKHTAVEAVASFLKERDENVFPGEADDEERKDSAQCIVRVVAKFSSPTNLENAERAEMEPKVKPLEWRVEGENRNGPWLWEASSIVKGYTIRHMPNDLYKLDGHGEWATLKAAKAAAQSDFASRIRSCLIDKPEAGEECCGKPVDMGCPEGGSAWVCCREAYPKRAAPSPLSAGDAGEIETITPHSYAQEYEFRGDGGDYTPTDAERTMIEDAICGYLGELSDAAETKK